MPIKQSTLEKKWYYRLAKVFFSILPLAAIAYFFLSQKGAFLEILLLLQNGNYVEVAKKYGVYIGFWIVLYPVVITLIWRVFLYTVFGGVENDMLRKNGKQVATKGSADSENKGLGPLLLIIIIVLILVYLSQQSSKSKPSSLNTPTQKSHSTEKVINGTTNDGNKTENCVPTECGSNWRCSGSYYVEGKRVDVNGLCFPPGMRPSDLYPSWSGSCRKCP